ncbi:MAG: tetratricopeptide repeat protein [Opitutaceae bacterium]|nr:tetratricopeptide repeat protein [Opitutaceae bacterium]
MKLRFAWMLVVLTGAGWADRIAGQTAGPSPLVGTGAAAAVVPGRWLAHEAWANDALRAGFSATAAAIYREILAEPALPEESRQRITLALVSAALEQGDTKIAEETLRSYNGPRDTGYQLRAGLLAAHSRRTAQARVAIEAAAGNVDDLMPAERGWWYYLQALVADQENASGRRNSMFDQAIKSAVSELQRARFTLGLEQSQLMAGQANEQRLQTLRNNMERIQGTSLAYDFVRAYAAELVSLGRKGEAQSEIQKQLAALPASRRDTADQLRLLLGLIAGEDSEAGRQAFRQLLREGQKPGTQRIALYLLARGAGIPTEREQVRRTLDELIGAPSPHPVIEDLLVVRAQLALADRLYDQAEEDARMLLERYPGSERKAAALGVRVTVAWELKRYRTAAEAITQLRAVLLPGRERSELGVLLAEAYFRAKDFRNAADAYEAALSEEPLAVEPGKLLFQRVLSEIRAGRLDRAQALLDETAASPVFDPVNRWQAEWNLVKEMQLSNQMEAAYARANHLLDGAGPAMPPELRTRMLWLRAKLSFEAGKLQADPGQLQTTLRLVDELQSALQSGAATVEPALRSEVLSTAQLLKAQALLTLGRDSEGGGLLDQLRTEYLGSRAAQESYIVQAARFSQKGDVVEAQRLLIKLVDEHPASEYAPLALYEAALVAERLGLDRNLNDAYKLLERLCHDYPKNEFVFYARLKQGDLMQKLNEAGVARQFYEDLINNFAQHPEEVRAELALAACLYGQSASSVTNYERATAIFERLRDRVDAPVDLRVEAGYRWGYALEKRGQIEKAQVVLWSLVDTFLLDAEAAAKLGATGRWWVSKALLELGQIHEDLKQLDEAQRAYALISERKLGGAALAEAKLARFRTTAEVR